MWVSLFPLRAVLNKERATGASAKAGLAEMLRKLPWHSRPSRGRPEIPPYGGIWSSLHDGATTAPQVRLIETSGRVSDAWPCMLATLTAVDICAIG